MLETLEDYRKAAEHAAELVTLLMPRNRDFPRGLRLRTAVTIGQAYSNLERLLELLDDDISQRDAQ